MKKSLREESQSRRQFMSRSACSAAGLTGIVSTITNMRLMQATLAASAEDITDYKALIVLFLYGGTNTDNLLMPGATHPGRASYDANRGVLAIPVANQLGINAGNLSGGEESFGLHPAMSDVQAMFNNNSGAGADGLSFVANVGTLNAPTQKIGDLQFNAPVPPQLFSHSDQQVQWQSSLPDQPFSSGWAGRVSDILTNANNNPNSAISMSVTLSGLNSLLVGLPGSPVQYSVTTTGAVSLNGYGTNYASALSDPSDIYSYQATTQGRRLEAFQKIMDYSHSNLMEDSYNTVVKRARVNEGFVGDALTAASTSGVNFDDIFINQHGVAAVSNLPSISSQLLTIAKLIAGRDCLGNRRQLFFCSQGGYDTHQDQGGFDSSGAEVSGDLDDNLTDLNNALASFNAAMKALGNADADFNYDDFLLATHSDFNRTFTPNGQIAGSSGSDHAWGGHHIVMGGSVKGGNVYGYYHDMQLAGPLDVNSTPGSRGRWIPTTSVDQFSAPLANWLGIDINGNGTIAGSPMANVFPNLDRFANPFQSNYDPSDPLGSANLDYLL